jgi:RHS repeat-associated protein
VNPFRYVGALGYYTDQTTKLYDVGARYYSPQVGRFWTQDPIRQASNRYVCIFDNPVNSSDPAGLIAPWLIYCMSQAWCRAMIGCVAGAAAFSLGELLIELGEGRTDLSRIGCVAACGCLAGAAIGALYDPAARELALRVLAIFGITDIAVRNCPELCRRICR